MMHLHVLMRLSILHLQWINYQVIVIRQQYLAILIQLEILQQKELTMLENIMKEMIMRRL